MLKRLILLISLVSLLFTGSPTSAMATASPLEVWGTATLPDIDYVSTLTGGSWRSEAETAVGFIDGFTTTTNHFVNRCHTGRRCVQFYFGTVPGSDLGRTVCKHGNCVITIERGTPVQYQTMLLLHEEGHVYGLPHQKTCVSVMDPIRTCWSHLNGKPFTTTEIRLLKKG